MVFYSLQLLGSTAKLVISDMGLHGVRLSRIGFALLLCSSLAIVCLCAQDRKFYKVLGVAPDADETTIKKAYRKLAL